MQTFPFVFFHNVLSKRIREFHDAGKDPAGRPDLQSVEKGRGGFLDGKEERYERDPGRVPRKTRGPGARVHAPPSPVRAPPAVTAPVSAFT